jgi:uncharacterized protein YhaN
MMQLIDLDIQRMPGFEKEGFAYRNLGNGMHIVYGSNGSGKTTSCKAVKTLLWPLEEEGIFPLLVHSLWEWRSEKNLIAREGSKHLISEELLKELSTVPARSYFFALDDLFNQQEKELAKMVAQEIQGGINLSAFRDSYTISPRFGCNEATQLTKYRREFDIIALEQGRVALKEEQLNRLKEQIEEAENGKKQLEQIKHAIHYLQLKKAADDLQKRLETYPSGLSRIRPDDEDVLHELLRKQPKHQIEKIDADKAERSRKNASALYDEIQYIDGRIKEREEERNALKTCLEEHARVLKVTPQFLLDELSYPSDENRSKERDLICKGMQFLLEWLDAQRNKAYILFQSLLLCISFLLSSLAVYQKEFFFGLLSISSFLLSSILLGRILVRRKKIVHRYLQISLPVPKQWQKESVEELLEVLQQQFLAGLDWQLRYEEMRKARETAVAYRRIEASFEEMLKERERKERAFLEQLPQSLRELPLKIALMEFTNLIAIQDFIARLEQMRERINCFSEDPIEELRQKKVLLKKYTGELEEKARLDGRLEQAFLQLQDKKLVTQSVEALLENQRGLETLAFSLDALRSQHTAISQEIQYLFSSKRYEEASHKVQEATLVFAQKEKEWKTHLIGLAFLKELEERFEQEQKPEVLKRASQYFERFSLGKYTIDTIKRLGETHRFCIQDHERSQPVFIEELSRGLMLQLLLAIRLGYLEVHEHKDLRLPLFLDEVLCHVDDDRFSWIAKALADIGKNRQIFLFTCQRATFYAWEKIAEQQPETKFHFIELDELQGRQKKKRAILQVPEKTFTIRAPLPNEHIAAYAKEAGLLGLDFPRTLGEQPSWLVLGDSEELFQVLKMGIKTIGHLLTILKLHPKSFAHGQLIQVKSILLEKLLLLAKIGNPPSIERHHLENAVAKGLFKDHYLDALDHCADRVGRKADSLLKALKNREVKRLQEKYIEMLEEYLLEEGFIDLRKPFSEEEIRKELCAAAPEFTPEIASYIDYLLSLFTANQPYLETQNSG